MTTAPHTSSRIRLDRWRGSQSGWLGSLFLGLALFLVYLINGRELGTEDTYRRRGFRLNLAR